MKIQGAGFGVDVPEGSLNASAYSFVFPDHGELPPNLAIRVDDAPSGSLEDHVALIVETYREGFEDLVVISKDPVRERGDWRYAINVLEWGPTDRRMRLKQMFIQVSMPTPLLFTVIGTDLAASFSRSEPVFDQIIRSFDPNGLQRVI